MSNTADTDGAALVMRFDALVEASGLTSVTPAIEPALALAALKVIYGLGGDLKRIATEKDDTFVLHDLSGRRSLVKISAATEPAGVVNLQTEAMRFAAQAAPHLPVPALLTGVDGGCEYDISSVIGGSSRILRVMEFLDGTTLAAVTPTQAQLQRVGRMHAELSTALAGFFHRDQHRILAWDLEHVPALREVLPQVDDPVRRRLATEILDQFEQIVCEQIPQLHAHVVHGDLSPHNVLVNDADKDFVTGIIDFGDVHFTPEIFDIAVALSNQLDPDAVDPWANALAMFSGYAQRRSIAADEISLLPVAVVARSLQRALIAQWRAAHDPSRADYVLSHAGRDWAVVERVTSSEWSSAADHLLAVNSFTTR